MATLNITNPQEEIDSYIDFCNARPELCRPTAELPDGTLVVFSEVTVQADSVSGKADVDGKIYALTLSKTPGASYLTVDESVRIEVADELPESPDANTLYVTPAGE